MNKTKTCKVCQQKMSEIESRCSKCGAYENKFLYFLSWFFGILTLLIALTSFSESIISGLILLIASLAILPPISKMIYNKTQIKIPQWLIGITFFILFIMGVNISSGKRDENKIKDFNTNKMKILSTIQDAIKIQNFENANKICEKYTAVADNNLYTLCSEVSGVMQKQK